LLPGDLPEPDDLDVLAVIAECERVSVDTRVDTRTVLSSA
jgi:hypothetical protein